MRTTEMHAYRPTKSCIWNSFLANNKKHIIITGNRSSGKTTLLSSLFPNTPPGITTWAVPKQGVYLKNNSTSATVQVGVYDGNLGGFENKMVLCNHGFAGLGIQTLEDCLQSDSQWVTIDEIGYLESVCTDYLDKITDLMEHKHLVAAVRKQNLPHLKTLCEREDVFLIDLDAPFGNTGCVIMASGLGKRFGENKLMADFCGKPLISYILDATSEIFQKRIVVTRHKEVETFCRKQGIPVIYHSLPLRSDTIRLGLKEVMDTDYCMFCTSDQPLLKKDTIASLVLSAINSSGHILRPISNNAPGSPVIFPKETYEALCNLPEGKGGGYVIQQHPELLWHLPVADPYELQDVDTPEDLFTLQNIYNKCF